MTTDLTENRNNEHVITALKNNWQQARHIETLRLQFAGVYIVAVFGGAFAAIKTQGGFLGIVSSLALLCLTVFCWGMTHKWNIAFVHQIQQADLCARLINIRRNDQNDTMHSIMGFPIRDKKLPYLNVRIMFNGFYATFTVFWLVALIYSVFMFCISLVS